MKKRRGWGLVGMDLGWPLLNWLRGLEPGELLVEPEQPVEAVWGVWGLPA